MIRLSGTAQRNRQKGFSMIELLIAMFILTIGLLGGMLIMLAAMATNSRNRMDSTAVALAQSTLDRIIVLSISDPNQQTIMTDCLGNQTTMNTNVGGSPLASFNGIGNAGVSNIDFSQPPVAGYQMLYAVCAVGAPDSNPQYYDVRWTIQGPFGTGNTQLVLVGAKHTNESGNGGGTTTKFFNLPITLRAIRGN
jgi:prepilin-type N-terminal cleavage/methylation domain-containing protein